MYIWHKLFQVNFCFNNNIVCIVKPSKDLYKRKVNSKIILNKYINTSTLELQINLNIAV